MPRILAHLVLAGTAVLAAPVLYFVLFVVLDAGLSDRMACGVANVVVASLFAAAWIRVWASQVVWTRNRLRWTILSFLWSVAGALAAAGAAAFSVANSSEELFAIAAGMMWIAIWIPSTALLWRESSSERELRLRRRAGGPIECPDCGFNLAGLGEARCPACGMQYTLDQLLDAVRKRELQLTDE